jgi:hypothetical protein
MRRSYETETAARIAVSSSLPHKRNSPEDEILAFRGYIEQTTG